MPGNNNYQFQLSVKQQETHNTREINKLLEHFWHHVVVLVVWVSLCIAKCREGGLDKGEEDERPPSGRLYNISDVYKR